MGLNPQQQEFKDAYLNPTSDTFGNAYKSALKAKYTDEYAKNITGQGNEWFSEILREKELLDLSEFVLKESLTMDEYDKDRVAALTALKHKSAQFVLSRLGKNKWSERTEVTGAEGEPLIMTSELASKYAINTSSIENSK